MRPTLPEYQSQSKTIQKKLQTDFSHEHRYKSPQENISKSNPTMNKKLCTMTK